MKRTDGKLLIRFISLRGHGSHYIRLARNSSTTWDRNEATHFVVGEVKTLADWLYLNEYWTLVVEPVVAGSDCCGLGEPHEHSPIENNPMLRLKDASAVRQLLETCQ